MSQTPVEIYATGATTVVGFGGRDILDETNLAACRNQLIDIAKESGCQVLAFDLTGVKLVPSGMLGLLASLRKEGIEVHIYNPSDDVVDVLETTNLDSVFPIHHIKVDRPES